MPVKLQPPPEAVHHPAHYGGDTPYEAIKVIEAWGLGFCLGNSVKYIARAGKKDAALQDLKKARWYLDREIKRLVPETNTDVRTALENGIEYAQECLAQHDTNYGRTTQSNRTEAELIESHIRQMQAALATL